MSKLYLIARNRTNKTDISWFTLSKQAFNDMFAFLALSEAKTMLAKQIFEDITAKIGDIIHDSPIKDVEKNVKTAVTAAFSRLDLVTRDEFEVQQQMIEHLCLQISDLQEEIARLREQDPAN